KSEQETLLGTALVYNLAHNPRMAVPVKTESVSSYLHWCQGQEADMLTALRSMVELESPSDDKPAIDKLGEFLARKFESLGGHVQFHKQIDFGNHLQVEFSGDRSRKPLLLLGHFDTVWPLGTLAHMP